MGKKDGFIKVLAAAVVAGKITLGVGAGVGLGAGVVGCSNDESFGENGGGRPNCEYADYKVVFSGLPVVAGIPTIDANRRPQYPDTLGFAKFLSKDGNRVREGEIGVIEFEGVRRGRTIGSVPGDGRYPSCGNGVHQLTTGGVPNTPSTSGKSQVVAIFTSEMLVRACTMN